MTTQECNLGNVLSVVLFKNCNIGYERAKSKVKFNAGNTSCIEVIKCLCGELGAIEEK